MSVAALEEQSRWEFLLRAWEDLDAPEGWRAEIIGEDLVLVPPPSDDHNEIVESIQEQLYEIKASGGAGMPRCGLYNTTGVRIPLIGQLYIPDLVVLPKPLPSRGNDHSAEHALLVLEVTSPKTAEADRKTKRWGYAHGPVPLYLLVDRLDEEGPTATLCSDPENGTYRTIHRVPFGEPIELPPPFSARIDTAEFPAGP